MPNSSQNIGGHAHSPHTSTTSKPPSPALPPPTQQISPIPAFYFYRENGLAVPLIALDELPAWLRIGREDWFRPEWQQYMSPVNDQSTIRVGEYEVFAEWGGAVYQLPMWRLVGGRNYEAGDGAAAGAGWEVDASERRGGEVMFHLDRGNGYDSVADGPEVDNGCSTGEGNSSGYTEEGGTRDRNVVWDEDGEQIADREVNREGETSISSWSSFDAPQPIFNVPIIPRAPLGLGLTKSAPSYVFWGLHPADFRAWPAGTADGNSSLAG
ncbi:predicted protein [Histoplasma capsulatum G186AR]|uniref:Uncharacterized protein n=1 Tax=Ajellomyces capsulatus (strain G186AR / H82 / ATCC MYA-2454 / RMSCC 2432) TaxID=447093 RepID=C0NAV6_AJECG|nr:uncharacterized protein HCBG_00252 [Histoplasma capsulatum G186AR]EEH10797.1 predicted protein [Histoplasma capsulatum G186AR]